MNHASWQELNDWVDAVLAPEAHARVEAHVRGCDACRAEVVAIERIRAGARRLLDEAAPVRAPVPRVGGRARVRTWQVVAPLVGLGVAAGAMLWVRAPAVPAPEVRAIETLRDDRAQVEARVAEQLAIIDTAIAELKVLLESQPANAELRATLAVAERDRSTLSAMARQVLEGAYPGGGM